MQQAGLQFTVQLASETDERYPPELQREEIPLFIAHQKANAFMRSAAIPDETIVVTADTIVWFNNMALGKPADRQDAVDMLKMLSGNVHQVYTAVCLTTNRKQHIFFKNIGEYFNVQLYKASNVANWH